MTITHRTGRQAIRTLLGTLLALASAACGPVDRTAHEELLAAIGSLDVTVYPAFVRQGGAEPRWDAESAGTIASAIGRFGIGTAGVSGEQVPVTGVWHMNQARMLEESARAFAAYLAARAPKTRYALLPEFLMRSDGHAVGIHAYVIDSSGRIALVVLTNSHWEGFDEMALDSPAACTDYLVGRLERELRSGSVARHD